MPNIQVVPSDETDKAILRLYLENRKDMSYEERQFFLDYLSLVWGSRFVMAEPVFELPDPAVGWNQKLNKEA